ncbi:uncharacterized protein LOC114432430 isoform X2 [Parambassis ranga]|uniref:Uncharacterized protein LOC114432430 isoform X2 n=1 Tax=Parambassis ranga TaxID=210632 RepID=A0A6P7HVX1_9TELE|nr:uncharacterized protein LOC114432430 isoform X2 [Parambassis ranga]
MSADDFQAMYASVMESMLKNAVAETTKLFEKMVDELKAEISKIKKENEDLKTRCSKFENASSRPVVDKGERSHCAPAQSDDCGKRDSAVQCDLVPFHTVLVEQCQPLSHGLLQNYAYEEMEDGLLEHRQEKSHDSSSESELQEDDLDTLVLSESTGSPQALESEYEEPPMIGECSTEEVTYPQKDDLTCSVKEGVQGSQNWSHDPEPSVVISLAEINNIEEEDDEKMQEEHTTAEKMMSQQHQGQTSGDGQTDVNEQHTDVQLGESSLVNIEEEETCVKELDDGANLKLSVCSKNEVFHLSSADKDSSVDTVSISSSNLDFQPEETSSVCTQPVQDRADTVAEDMMNGSPPSCVSESEKHNTSNSQEPSVEVEEEPVEAPPGTSVHLKKRHNSVTLQDALLFVEAMNQTVEKTFPFPQRMEPIQTQSASCMNTPKIPAEVSADPMTPLIPVHAVATPGVTLYIRDAPSPKEAKVQILAVTPTQQHSSTPFDTSLNSSSVAATKTAAESLRHAVTSTVANGKLVTVGTHRIIIVPRPASSFAFNQIALLSSTQHPTVSSTAAQNTGTPPTSMLTQSSPGTPSLSSASQKTEITPTTSVPVVHTQVTTTSENPPPQKIKIIIPRRSSVVTLQKYRSQINCLTEKTQSAAPTAPAGSTPHLTSQESSVLATGETVLPQNTENITDSLSESQESGALATESQESSALATESQESSALATESQESSALATESRESRDFATESQESGALATESQESGVLATESQESGVLATESRESGVLATESRESRDFATESRESSALATESRESRDFATGETVLPQNTENITDSLSESQESGVLATESRESGVLATESRESSVLATGETVLPQNTENITDSLESLSHSADACEAETCSELKTSDDSTSVSPVVQQKLSAVVRLTRLPFSISTEESISVSKLQLKDFYKDGKQASLSHSISYSEMTSVSPETCPSFDDGQPDLPVESTLNKARSGDCPDDEGSYTQTSVCDRRRLKINSLVSRLQSHLKTHSQARGTKTHTEKENTAVGSEEPQSESDGVSDKNQMGARKVTGRGRSLAAGPERSTKESTSPQKINLTSLSPRRSSSGRESIAERIKESPRTPPYSGSCTTPQRSSKESFNPKRISAGTSPDMSGRLRSSSFINDGPSSKKIKRESSSFSPMRGRLSNGETCSPSVKSPQQDRRRGKCTLVSKARLIQEGQKKNHNVVNALKVAKAARAKMIAKIKCSNTSKLQTRKSARNEVNPKVVKRCKTTGVWIPPTSEEFKKVLEKEKESLPPVTPKPVQHPVVLKPGPFLSPLQPLSVIGRHLLRNQCGVCGRVLSNTAALESHVSLHAEHRPFSCSSCGKTFPDLKSFKRHGRVHQNGKIYKCPQCGKGFAYKFGLTKHIEMVHGKIKPFSCHICKKKFFTNRDLVIHLRSHTGEKPFQCNLCDKKFIRGVELNVHLRWHNGEKRHWCPYCGKGFLDYNNLKRHKYTHTGEKPHPCPHCPKHFTQSGHLKKHVKNVHKVK